MKETGERFKHTPRYTKTIIQLCDRKWSIKHAVDVIHSISHLIRANESRNTKFINGAKKLEVLLLFADYSFLASGWNGIPKSFGSICDIYHRWNQMLAGCKPTWGYERQYDRFRWKTGSTTSGKEEQQMASVRWKRGVPQKVLEKRGMKMNSVKFKLRSAKRGEVEECKMKLRSAKRGGCSSAEWTWGAPKTGRLGSA